MQQFTNYRFITVGLLIAVLLASLITLHPALAKSSTPAVTLYAKQNAQTKHYYFSPTYVTIQQMQANVIVRNTTKQWLTVSWDNRSVKVVAGKSQSRVINAVNLSADDNDTYVILVNLVDEKGVLQTQAGICVTYSCPDY